MAFRVLLCLDDPSDSRELQELCRRLDCETHDAASGADVRAATERGGLDVCLVGLRRLHRDPEILSVLTRGAEAPSVLVASQEAELPQTLAQVRAGADGALVLPAGLGALACALEQARTARMRRIERGLRDEDEVARAHALVGRSREHRRIVEGIARVATTPNTTVLLRGEPGVGKERVARAIHAESRRSRGPFVALRCLRDAPEELEERLFGREPEEGRTGRAGLLYAARGGTLYVEEVSRLDADCQAELSRTLQDRTWRRLGDAGDQPLEARVVVGTSLDLAAEVEAGRFDEELFYRLNVLSIPIPPLRERREDVAPFARLFLARARERMGRGPTGPAPEALRLLEERDWPGNLPELEAVVTAAAARCDDELLRPEHLGDGGAADTEAGPLTLNPEDLSVKSMEKALIRHVLEVTAGNRSQAARVLQVNRATLYNKLKLYEL